ncbi:hypothetical protein SO802_016614 [Lithocarpus litseifolius]|uniref:DUF4283 domain-containing protein n=1 Tax=Lithocarpus litseifolius TaxID=425828 RepID=A0AAW2CZ82_9ROSI
MAEDVINSMVNLKLTSEKEKEIQVSDEGRMEEIDKCVLSLLGKFLTCKPYNREAVKNTLRKVLGLSKELQISKWRAGMSANNVVLEHASLWVQIWGVPFDMLSPRVATEIGNKMGVVEDVERSNGNHHWVDYKYERLLVFYHYYGILGHDIQHCPPHFAVSKKTTPVKYQYGDRLKAVSGQNKSPTHRRNANQPGDASLDKDDNQIEENSRVHAAETAAARASTLSDNQYSHNDKGGLDGC